LQNLWDIKREGADKMCKKRTVFIEILTTILYNEFYLHGVFKKKAANLGRNEEHL